MDRAYALPAMRIRLEGPAIQIDKDRPHDQLEIAVRRKEEASNSKMLIFSTTGFFSAFSTFKIYKFKGAKGAKESKCRKV